MKSSIRKNLKYGAGILDGANDDPVLHAALTKPLPPIKKTKESDDDEVESSTSKDDSFCIVS